MELHVWIRLLIIFCDNTDYYVLVKECNICEGSWESLEEYGVKNSLAKSNTSSGLWINTACTKSASIALSSG